MTSPIADAEQKTITSGGKTYAVQALGGDTYAVLLDGIPVGRVVYTFGSANGVPEGDVVTEDELTAMGEAWFAAVDG